MTDPMPHGCALHSNRVHGDTRGKLVALEGGISLPFAIARVFYLYDTLPGMDRGHHAHREQQQWLVCLAGSCRMTLDDGRQRHDVILDDPAMSLHVSPMVWGELHDFASGSVLMVLVDAPYDEGDYIRDYATFQSAVAA